MEYTEFKYMTVNYSAFYANTILHKQIRKIIILKLIEFLSKGINIIFIDETSISTIKNPKKAWSNRFGIA